MPSPFAKINALAAPETAREKLLVAALELFAEHGVDGTTTRDIAKLAGQNIALISYHFGGKEQLYHELLRMLPMGEVITQFPEIHDAITSPATRKEITPDMARAMIKTLLCNTIMQMLGHREALLIARLVIREYTRPTAAFEIIYANGIETIHKTVTALFAIATGRSSETQDAIIQTHMLLGQMLSFVFAHAIICRRLQKESINDALIKKITAILDQNIDLLTQPSLS